jgi:hypothetical protein
MQDGCPEQRDDCGWKRLRQGVSGDGADYEVSETARIREIVEPAHRRLLFVVKLLLVMAKGNRRLLGGLTGELKAECGDCRRSTEVSLGVKVEWSGGWRRVWDSGAEGVIDGGVCALSLSEGGWALMGVRL